MADGRWPSCDVPVVMAAGGGVAGSQLAMAGAGGWWLAQLSREHSQKPSTVPMKQKILTAKWLARILGLKLVLL